MTRLRARPAWAVRPTRLGLLAREREGDVASVREDLRRPPTEVAALGHRAALDGTSDDDDELEQAFIAVKEVATEPAARALVPLIRARLDAWEPEHRASAIALLGHLGEPIVPLVSAALGEIDDDDLGALLCALEGLPVAELAPSLLARLRALDPKSRNAFAWIEALVDLAIEDRALMEPILRDHFVSRGGRWRARAEAILARWA